MESENFHKINITKEKTFSPSVAESLQNIIKNEGFVTHNVYKRQVSTGGDNYMGLLFEVDIKGKTPDEEKELNLFIKESIIHASEVINIAGAYAKEQLFYDKLTKMFEELEEEATVPEAEKLRRIKGYKVSSLDAIIMENVSKQDYRTIDRMEVFSLEFAEMSIKQLAIFHGLTFVLKAKKPEYYSKILKHISKSVFNKKNTKEVLQNMFNTTMSFLEEEWRSKVNPCLTKFVDEYFKSYETDNSAITCLCHGDYRQSNILIKTINSNIVDLIPIDYQLMHIGNPLNDFFYFVYLGSDREFRKKHLVSLKNLYYNTLQVFLNYFDMNIEDIYPRKRFEVDFEDRREMGLIYASLLYTIVFVLEEEAPGLDDLTKGNLKMDPKIHDRILELLEEFEELGYFSSSSPS